MPRRILPLIPADLVVVQVLPTPDRVTTITAPRLAQSACPLCGDLSGQIHSHYTRTLADLPWQGRAVIIQVRVRRFRCASVGCPRRVFTERLPGFAPPRARRTARLGGIQRHIGPALGGEAGSSLARRLSMPVSGDTLLRLVRVAELEAHPSPRVVGIDEWAELLKVPAAQRLEWQRRVGVAASATAPSSATWSAGASSIFCPNAAARPSRPGCASIPASRLSPATAVAPVPRERAKAPLHWPSIGCADRTFLASSPDAMQVADRWHLLRKLGDALQGAVDRHRGAVRQAARMVAQGQTAEQGETALAPYSTKTTQLRADQRAQRQGRYEELSRLHRSGLSAEAIAPALGMGSRPSTWWNLRCS